MIGCKGLAILALVSITSLLSINSYAEEGIEFPHDEGGHVFNFHFDVDGNRITISGIVVNEDVPPWESLFQWFVPDCAHLTLIESWNCHNPTSPGYWSYAFYYVILAEFEDGCEGDIAVWLKENPGNIIYIPSDKNYYPTKAEIRDRCDNPIRRRAIYRGELDQDEQFVLFAEVKSRDPNFYFPDELKGIATFYGIKVNYMLRYDCGEEGRAEYKSDPLKASMIYDESINNNRRLLNFVLDYKNSPSYSCGVENIRMRIERLTFADNFALAGAMTNTVCYPWNSHLKFGTNIEVQSVDRPYDCGVLTAEITTTPDYDLHSFGAILQEEFTTAPDETNYHIQPPYHHQTLEPDFILKVDGGPDRYISYGLNHITVHHGFQANAITLTGTVETAPDGVPVIAHDAGDIYLHANMTPTLADQERIHYEWNIASSNGGDAEFATQGRHPRLIPQIPGEIYITCRIFDSQSNTESTSPPLTVRIKPSITITPLEENRFCFGDESPGVLTIPATGTCHATLTPPNSNLLNLIEWSITEVGESELEEVPNGQDATFIFTGLPFHNHDFGPKIIMASIPSYKAQDQENVNIFFEKEEFNNPNYMGDYPNWYYYWQEEDGPVPGLQETYFLFEAGFIGDYNRYTDIIRIGPEASLLFEERPMGGGIVFFGKRGADWAATVVAHEEDHRTEDSKWQPPAGEWYIPYGNHWLFEPLCPWPVPGDDDCFVNPYDQDSDGLPDNYESHLNALYGLELQIDDPDTYNMWEHFGIYGYYYVGDSEIMAYLRSNPIVAPSELDWSHGIYSLQWPISGLGLDTTKTLIKIDRGQK